LPLYEYSCPKCGRFELIRKFSDAPLKTCPTCGKPVQKLLSAPAIQFKGTGWYITDYSRKSSGGDGGSKGDGSKESSSSTSDSAPSGGTAKEATGSKASEKAATKTSEKK
jgi:putative FmdB family regulatory protein